MWVFGDSMNGEVEGWRDVDGDYGVLVGRVIMVCALHGVGLLLFLLVR